jgi:hypothetical protein
MILECVPQAEIFQHATATTKFRLVNVQASMNFEPIIIEAGIVQSV